MTKRPKLPSGIRLKVYQRDGFKCQDCGWKPPVPEGYRGHHPITVVLGYKWVSAFGSRRKAYPGDHMAREIPITLSLEVDHIRPLSRGGAFRDLANLQALCSKCNNLKGTRWRA